MIVLPRISATHVAKQTSGIYVIMGYGGGDVYILMVLIST